MTEAAARISGGISAEEADALKRFFESQLRCFDERAGQLMSAYASLEEEYKKVNFELESKNAELRSNLARREALEREVRQAKTMAALGEMSATVAHEIRNPLGAMGMWAGLLEREMDPQDPKRKTLGKITDGLARLNKIVTNLLVYTRPMLAEFKTVRLDALLDEAVDFTEIEIDRLGREIAVEKRFDCPAPPCVRADPEKVSQAVMNLCLNAVQAMGDGGKLSVWLTATGGGEQAVFSIADTGCGINSEDIARVFDPFFTTKTDGTGLGLAIVKKIIESHGGTIEIESERGAGTRVNCYLPIAKQ
jgi:signal transduction histidine kinase